MEKGQGEGRNESLLQYRQSKILTKVVVAVGHEEEAS